MIKLHHYILTEPDADGENESAAKIALFNRIMAENVDPHLIKFHDSERCLFRNGVISLDPEGAYLLVSASLDGY